MKKHFLILLTLFLIHSLTTLIAQNKITGRELSVYAGAGLFTVKDEYISLRRYAGQFSTFGAEWGTLFDSARIHLNIEYQRGGEIANNNAKADIYQTRLYYDNQFYYKKVSVFGKEADLFIGPAGIMATHIRIQKVADKNILMENYLSLFIDNSIAVSMSLSMPLNDSWLISSNASLNIVSVGIKLVDFTKQVKDPTVKVLLPFTNLNGRIDIGFDYLISNSFTISGKYLFQFIRNTSWDYLMAAGDNAIMKVSYDW